MDRATRHEDGARILSVMSPEPESWDQLYDLSPGDWIGKFVFERQIGCGAISLVIRARDCETDRILAVKLVNPRTIVAADADARAYLFRQLDLAKSISHRNLVAIYDFGRWQHSGVVYIAMEYVDGPSLRTWIEQQPRTLGDIIQVFIQVAHGLDVAHLGGLIHADFNLDDAIIGADAKVTGFGLFGSPPHRALSVIGTPTSMSPEQMRGEAPCARSDQFALCVCMWRALYGRPPFAGSTAVETFQSVLRGEIESPHPRIVPLDLEMILRRGLATSPQNRWPDIGALATALGNLRLNT